MTKLSDVEYIKKHYPITPTEKVAKDLNLTPSKVRTIARKNNITKSELYLENLKRDLVKSRRRWYESNIPAFKPTTFQEQIIFGSLLGDGYISQGAKRSINAYYQEHFGEDQRKYRQWKLSSLKSLGFSIKGNYLRSPSHPYFTKLRQALYHNRNKIVTSSFLSKCTHKIFLSTLYLDDGSLMLTYRYNKNKNTVYCYASIVIYTLNFTRDENKLLAEHLNKTFGTHFVVSGPPHGKGSLLKINKEKEVKHLLKVIEPYTQPIKSMSYKNNLDENLQLKLDMIKRKYGNNVKIIWSSSNRSRSYTNKEIDRIIHLKLSGHTDQYIANQLDRSYWSIVYKLSELRKKELL